MIIYKTYRIKQIIFLKIFGLIGTRYQKDSGESICNHVLSM